MYHFKSWKRLSGLALVALTLAVFSGTALGKGLPKVFEWTAYGVKSSGYAQSVAIGNAISEDGYKLRVVPAKNDISRMLPLKTKRMDFSAMGVGAYMAQEGTLDFATQKWGPQPVRLLLCSWPDTNAVVSTAADANILKASDLRGKRVAWIVGSPALNTNVEANLAFGGLTWNDVVKVEVPGWGASMQGLVDGTIDAAFSVSDSSKLFELQGSPRGLRFFPLPHNDKAGWARLNKIAPWQVPSVGTVGAGVTKEKPLEGATYGYPILISYDRVSDQANYELTQLIHTRFDKFKGAHPSAPGWDIKRQNFSWIIPYHNGTIKYFKKIGVWNDKHQKHNDNLVKRQKVLIATFDKALKAKGSADDEAFTKYWMEQRFNALTKAGFDPVWGKE